MMNKYFLMVSLATIAVAMSVYSWTQQPNRLIHEKSPYLLQHAYNPVDWYPWGQEAFDKAKKDDKPLFLSVGYSTCHWCHVMAEESYSNPKVAQVLNQYFVAIKVDREERPDIDSTYMQALEVMTGSGGWPMNMFLTPDLRPFYGGTYFSPDGFISTLKTIADQWHNNRNAIMQSTGKLYQIIQQQMQQTVNGTQSIGEDTLKKAYEQLRSGFDSQYGGFGVRIKFPQAHLLSFLLRYHKRIHDPQALLMVEKTLQAMAEGGIYDQIGGGFHRYSTDAMWFVPHFEKMLYDQAILSHVYLEAYQVTGKEEYAHIARQSLDYVLRDMASKQGSFYTAQDADSIDQLTQRKSEGAFYLWTKKDIIKALGKERGEIVSFYFGLEGSGNINASRNKEFLGKNILYVAHSIEETAKHFGKSTQDVLSIIAQSRSILLSLRNQRPKPPTDDKTLTDLNGLMIASLSFGASVLNEHRYLDAAKKAADFLLKTIKTPDGHLMHRYRDGQVAISGFLDDYAFFSYGLFELYEASFDSHYLAQSKQIAQQMTTLFGDKVQGGFYFTAKDSGHLLARRKEFNDNAIPSGNSIATLILLKLSRLTVMPSLETWAQQNLSAVSLAMHDNPSGYAQMLAALDYTLGPSKEIVIAGNQDNPGTQAMLGEINKYFIPHKVVCLHPIDVEQAKAIEALVPFVRDQNMLNGKTTAYVCQNYHCQFPTNELGRFREILKETKSNK